MLLMAVAVLQTACAQKIPDAVKTSFNTKYPNTNVSKWDVDRNGNFEAHFKIKNISYNADFKKDGSWIETETSVDYMDLPESIKAVLKNEYSDWKIVELELVDHHSKGKFYDLEIKKGKVKKDVEVTEQGQVIN